MDKDLIGNLESEGTAREAAVERFLERVRVDRHIIACFVYGSTARGDFWFNSDIDVILITTDETNPDVFRTLYDDGKWFEANIISRNRFRTICEGAMAWGSMASIRHSGRLVYCEDSSLKDYFDEDGKLGTYEMLTQAFLRGAYCHFNFQKIEKYCGRGQRERAYNTLVNLINQFASLIIILNRRALEREVIEQALEIDPESFAPYPPVIYGPIPEIAVITKTTATIRSYIIDNSDVIFQLLLDYMKDEGRELPLSTIHDRFTKLLRTTESAAVYGACEILREAGYLERGEYEARLTKKSTVPFLEPSYSCAEGVLQ